MSSSSNGNPNRGTRRKSNPIFGKKGQCQGIACEKQGIRLHPNQPYVYAGKQCARSCADESSNLCKMCMKKSFLNGRVTNAELHPDSRAYFPPGSSLSHIGLSERVRGYAEKLAKAEKVVVAAEKEVVAAVKKTETAVKVASNLAARMAAAGGGGGGGGAEALWLPPSQARSSRRGGLTPYHPPLRAGLAKIWRKRRTVKRKSNSGSEYSNSNVRIK